MQNKAARVVITWLNKAREAAQQRDRSLTESLTIDSRREGAEYSNDEEDDEDDEFVYDIQVYIHLVLSRNSYGTCAPPIF